MPTADKKVTVIKIGGSLLSRERSPELTRGLAAYLRGHRGVIVHGGGREISRFSERLGIRTRFVNGLRFTGEKLMEIVEMVLSGKVNPDLVSQLNDLGVPAMGLSGRDGSSVVARRVPSLGRVGTPVAVDKRLIRDILFRGTVPVYASVASDGRGGALNVNADVMASAIATAMRAHRLILFTDVPGILDRSGKTIPLISPRTGRDLIARKIVTGGMIPKFESSLNALKKGVREIWVLEGRLPLNRAKGTLISKHGSKAKHPFSQI